MVKRLAEKQSAHDKCVEGLAKSQVKEKWAVKADLSDWEKPPKVVGYIPDIHAIKNTVQKIIEVETEETLETDKVQITAFRNYAETHNQVFFWLYVANEKGQCEYKGAWHKNT